MKKPTLTERLAKSEHMRKHYFARYQSYADAFDYLAERAKPDDAAAAHMLREEKFQKMQDELNKAVDKSE